MPVTSLTEIERAIRAAWSEWTADPVDQVGWSSAVPARGQCGVSALVVQEMVGGELLLSEVTYADGTPQGMHYFNRLADGAEVDLTREQFTDGEVVGEPRVVPRAPDLSRGRLPGNYRLLAERVRRELHGIADPGRPVTIKAVCVLPDGRILLCRNHRDEWELPGGRPQRGETFAQTIGRELTEESGLAVEVEELIGLEPLEVVPGHWVDVLAFRCDVPAGAADRPLTVSDEHTAVAFVDPATIPADAFAAPYRRLVGAAGQPSAAVPTPSGHHPG